MVYDDPSCNVCTMLLIELLALENYVPESIGGPRDEPTAIQNIDQAIHKYAATVDLIILVCDKKYLKLIHDIAQWTSDRRHVMALAFVVPTNFDAADKKNWKEHIDEQLQESGTSCGNLFPRGIFWLNDMPSNGMKNVTKRSAHDGLVGDDRIELLRACVGNQDDQEYEIKLHPEPQNKSQTCCLS
jgi:hypothetical protein